MSIVEENSWQGHRLTVTWHDSSFIPPRELITQASGICFNNKGRIILVTTDGSSWHLPGGHPEGDEDMKTTFIREVKEEACTIVTNLVYLGAQEITDPENNTGLSTYYQVRFWARVRLQKFKGKHEMVGRKLVKPSEINLSLNWRPNRILEAILKAALDCEGKFRRKNRE